MSKLQETQHLPFQRRLKLLLPRLRTQTHTYTTLSPTVVSSPLRDIFKTTFHPLTQLVLYIILPGRL